MDDQHLLDQLNAWVTAEVEPSFPRGFGACMWVSHVVEERHGIEATEGIFVDDPDRLIEEIEACHVYTHAWNVKPDGTIIDGTAGQFHAAGPVARIIGTDDPEHRHYLTWEQIPAELHDAVDDAVQASYPDPTNAG